MYDHHVIRTSWLRTNLFLLYSRRENTENNLPHLRGLISALSFLILLWLINVDSDLKKGVVARDRAQRCLQVSQAESSF